MLDLLRGSRRATNRKPQPLSPECQVFSLWHGMVAEPAPNETPTSRTKKPGGLDEEPREVMCFLDPILVASVCHGLIYLRNDFDGFSSVRIGTDRDHFSPGCTPTTGNRTLMGPRPTAFAQTCCPFAGTFLRHHHRKPAGLRRIRTMALRARRRGSCGTPLRLMDAIIPGFSIFWWFDTGHFHCENAVSLIRIRRNLVTRP